MGGLADMANKYLKDLYSPSLTHLNDIYEMFVGWL